MDKLILYRELVEKLLQEHADLMNSQPVPGEEVDCIFDENREHYMMLRYGWPRGKRAYYVKLHVRIKDGKIRIERVDSECHHPPPQFRLFRAKL